MGIGSPPDVPACGQRDVEHACRAPRVLEEQFVEVAHPVEDQHVGVLRLDAQVLLHHRGVGGEIRSAHQADNATRKKAPAPLRGLAPVQARCRDGGWAAPNGPQAVRDYFFSGGGTGADCPATKG